MSQILKNLGIKEISMGSCVGGDTLVDNGSSNYIESFNPTNGDLLGKVQLCNEDDYEKKYIRTKTWVSRNA